MANFKDIMAMCLDGGSYAAISAALGERVKFVCVWGLVSTCLVRQLASRFQG